MISLNQGVRALYAGSLPERSVVITFDDGTYDFYRLARPLLREFPFPALTTYYSDFNRPVFDVMCSYLLWKGQGQVFEFPEALLSPVLLDDKGRAMGPGRNSPICLSSRTLRQEKDALLASIATRLKIDYDNL